MPVAVIAEIAADGVIGLMKLNLFNASEEVVAGTEVPGGGARGRLYLTLCRQHQNHWFRGVSLFSVSLIVSEVTG